MIHSAGWNAAKALGRSAGDLALSAAGIPLWWALARVLGDGLSLSDDQFDALMAAAAETAAATLSQIDDRLP